MPPRTDPTGSFAFFFYGTLCDSDVRNAVIGRAVAVTPAVLDGYEAVPVERGRFPILRFQPGREATGALCEGVTVDEAARLGFYEHEGRDYTARQVSVRDGNGAARPAWVFLPTAGLRRGPGRWDLAEWQRFAKREFLVGVQRAMAGIEPERLQPYRVIWSQRSGRGGR